MKRLWVILFVIPVFAQEPCSSKEFLRLKNVNIKNMTEREYQYFMMMSEKCSDSDGETLLEKLFKTRVDPAEVFNYSLLCRFIKGIISSIGNNNDIPILKDIFPPVFLRLKPAAVFKTASKL